MRTVVSAALGMLELLQEQAQASPMGLTFSSSFPLYCLLILTVTILLTLLLVPLPLVQTPSLFRTVLYISLLSVLFLKMFSLNHSPLHRRFHLICSLIILMLGSQESDYIKSLSKSLEMLNTMVNNTLDFARADSGRIILDQASLPLYHFNLHSLSTLSSPSLFILVLRIT